MKARLDNHYVTNNPKVVVANRGKIKRYYFRVIDRTKKVYYDRGGKGVHPASEPTQIEEPFPTAAHYAFICGA